MKNIAARIAVGIMRAVYVPVKLFPRKNKIAILSRQGREKSEDICALEAYLADRYPEITVETLVKMVEGPGYAFHMLRQMLAIATSRVVVIDGYCIAASVLKHKSGTRIVQIWHSSAAIKKFGYQCIDAPSGHSRQMAEVMCMHKNYDYVICPSRATGELFCEGFGVSPDKLRLYGLPRLEKIAKSAHDGEQRPKPQDDDKRKIVLYVPTLRKIRPVDAASLIGAIDSEKYRLVVRLHPLDKVDEEVRSSIDAGEEYSTSGWLDACDYIITDYSALGIEAALYEKPVFYYVYDIEEYQRETGLNINPLEEMSWCASTDAREIAEMIEQEYDFTKLKSFRDKYIEVNPENCTESLAEFIAEMVNGEY